MLPAPKSPEWHARRAGKITGSAANKIMAGGDAMFNLWLELTGQREPDDLSGVLPVQMGSFLEPFICGWFTRETGHEITHRNEWRVNSIIPWRACEIDGIAWIDGVAHVMDAKFSLGWKKPDELLAEYMPQLTHNAEVCGLDRWALVVLEGTGKFWWRAGDVDPFYAAALLEREKAFLECVTTKTAPPGFEPIAPPIPASELIECDMTGNNGFADAAASWLSTRDAASKFKMAEKTIKELTPANAVRAFGYGIEVKRDKANRLGIKEMK